MKTTRQLSVHQNNVDERESDNTNKIAVSLHAVDEIETDDAALHSHKKEMKVKTARRSSVH